MIITKWKVVKRQRTIKLDAFALVMISENMTIKVLSVPPLAPGIGMNALTLETKEAKATIVNQSALLILSAQAQIIGIEKYSNILTIFALTTLTSNFLL